MLVRNLLGARFKETPKDCQIASHALMMKGGYMKFMCAGSYSLFTPAKRIMRKIENILREEMDRVGGQEVLFPVVMPASLGRVRQIHEHRERDGSVYRSQRHENGSRYDA